MESTGKLIERPVLYEKYEKAFRSHRLVYLGTNTGFGKTTSVLMWLEKKGVEFSYASASEEDFWQQIEKKPFISKKWIVLDDLYLLQEENEQQRMVEFISKQKSKMVLIGRSALPSWLKVFWATGQMACSDWKDFCFTKEEVAQYFAMEGVHVSGKILERITRNTYGMPLSIAFFAIRLKREGFNEMTGMHVIEDLYGWFDYTVFQNLSEQERFFILDLAVADHFNAELARLLTGQNNAEYLLIKIMNLGNIIRPCKEQLSDRVEYEFGYNEFRSYLRHKQEATMAYDDILQLYQKVGLYYELHEDYVEALKYYSLGKNTTKVYTLLVENSKRNASQARFSETRSYAETLSKEQIMGSPELMCGFSMMNALYFQPEESELWYNRLKDFSKTVDPKDTRYKAAMEKLMYLDVALPQRGSKNITDTFRSIAGVMSGKKISIQDISVTGDMPSLMSGGKDFCSWSKHDRLFYKTLRSAIETVLGRGGIGVADTAIAESLYNKTTDLNFTEPLVYLNRAYNQISSGGTLPMLFANVGIVARIYAASGVIENAFRVLESVRDRAIKDKVQTFIPNLDAVLVLFSLYRGEVETARNWFQKQAPDETKEFYTLYRFQYLVKARIYIIEKRYVSACMILDRMKAYCEAYGRTYDYLVSSYLKAVVLYRMNDDKWEAEMNEVLQKCEELKFTRIVADEGAAGLEPLSKLHYTCSKQFYQMVLDLTREQSINYPTYLEPVQFAEIHLTETEKNVLKLIVKGLSNDRIAEILGISLRTVKFHSGNIYSKMGVKNRTQAIRFALDNKII